LLIRPAGTRSPTKPIGRTPNDPQVIELNRRAATQLPNAPQIEIVAGAGYLFEEPGALYRGAELARDWFAGNLAVGARR
jgi:putative phosphoribosyl transferase